jgi:hypothetical protein
MQELLTAIYCDVDDFCKDFENYCKPHFLEKNIDKSKFFPKSQMSLSEVMTILIYFHLSQYRTFKGYYKNCVCNTLKAYFPKVLSYNRFVEIMQIAILPLTLYLMKYRPVKCSGISFIDSTTLDVCHNRRIHSHKVFDGLATRGKSAQV